MVDDMAVLDAAPEAAAEATAAVETGAEAEATAATAATAAAGAETAAPPVEVAWPEESETPDEGEGESGAGGEAAGGGDPSATDAATGQEAASGGAASARYGTAALSRMLKEQPELQAAAEASPRVKAQLYQMARRSQELAEYQELMPSLGRAREAAEAQQALQNYDQAYFGKAPEQFWQGLHQASGATGAYERNVQFLHQLFLDGLGERAASQGNESLTGAVEAIREALGWGNSRHARSQATDGNRGANEATTSLPPQIRQQLEELQHLRTRLSAEQQQQSEAFVNAAGEEVGRELRGFVDGILAETGFSDYEKANIARDFIERVSELSEQDRVHNAALEDILARRGSTPEARAEIVRRSLQWVRQNGREVLEPILKQVGASLKQRQQQRQAARAKARVEPAAASAVASPAAQPSARDLVRQAETKLGRRLTDREILELA